MIELATVKATEGYYEVATCSEVNEVVEDEKLRKILMDHCKTRKGSIEVLKFIIVKNKEGDVMKVWALEVYYGPFGVMIFLDNP